MPCYDRIASDDSRIQDAKEMELLGQLLCYVCSRAERGDKWKDVLRENPGLADWWAAHKAEDDQREKERKAHAAREQIRRTAIAKLTPQERAALGLNRDI